MTEETEPERRQTGRVKRFLWSLQNPGRVARFNRWRRTKAVVTKGFLAFRDLTVVAVCVIVVVAGVTTVGRLRSEDCRTTNGTRYSAATVAHNDVDRDREFWTLVDVETGGIEEPFRTQIFSRMDADDRLIDATYAPRDCSGPDYNPGDGPFRPDERITQ